MRVTIVRALAILPIFCCRPAGIRGGRARSCPLASSNPAPKICVLPEHGLNCSTNDRLLRETPFQRVIHFAGAERCGHFAGCAVYGLTELGGMRCDYRWENDYLGPEPQLADIEAALQRCR